jgi:hypothetical protein
MAVDDHFIASGYFAGPDLINDAGTLTMPNIAGIKEAACETRPDNPAGHKGKCHKWSFQASYVGTTTPGAAWAGVFWQAPVNNWGTAPGVMVAPGATKLKLRAWGAVGGESLSFSVGGIGGSMCSDDIQLGQQGGTKVTLTTTPTEYEVPFNGQLYTRSVIGGFVWSVAATTTTAVTTFYVDDIHWAAN